MKVELIAYTPDPAWVIEQAASVCYNSIPTHRCELAEKCYRSGHHSVLEHVSFTFRIEGISRACSHQLVRHRMGSYSQRSQRYCEEDEFEYITPVNIAPATYDEFMNDAKELYLHFKGIGVPNEDARYALPNACATTIYVTMNLRSLINFMRERLCTRAQWEIRNVAKEMRELVVSAMPQAGEMLRPKCEANPQYPFCPESKSCGYHLKLSEVYRR